MILGSVFVTSFTHDCVTGKLKSLVVKSGIRLELFSQSLVRVQGVLNSVGCLLAGLLEKSL
ncbi:hypothetical protein D6810_02920 [Candidatus Dojkabacteria bacterium]|uniref:Uncharacterized protein n=1 Tax=Candidatus Dojkabacteria bacterium TaxID=2099670 RepID=A0A3M0YXL7_9BACT|nr:MAG: hypothetical protein D6810_02920 [Candidatus Dojkabacteria bacterium]